MNRLRALMMGLRTLGACLAATLVAACQPGPAAPVGELAPVGPTVTAEVVRVTDGDTIDVKIGGQRFAVRYIGIDAPERPGPFTGPERLGDEAAQANERMVGGAIVHLERDVSDTDRFGRLLRYVWLRDGGRWVMANRELVRLGLAEARSYPPDTRWQDELDKAEDQAMADSAGIWAPASLAPTGWVGIGRRGVVVAG